MLFRSYFAYFGAAAGDPAEGWYAYDLGAWRIYALNANRSDVGGCGTASPQYAWLVADIDAHPGGCQMAYWHHARWSSGTFHGSDPRTDAFWSLLVARGAELVVVGHEHNYERFAPLDASGVPDPAGTREIVVGTGGFSHHAEFGPPLGGSEVRNGDTWGVLQVTLHADRYEWDFLPEAGHSFTDSGSTYCH